MKVLSGFAIIAALAATNASAQGVNLTGQFRCVQVCAPGLQGQPAFVTQNGWNLNLLNEAGEPSRAWIDWSGHIWAESWHEGALFSSDGMVIQFDRGTIWQRDLGGPPPAIPDRSNASRATKLAPAKIDNTNKRVSAPIPTRPAGPRCRSRCGPATPPAARNSCSHSSSARASRARACSQGSRRAASSRCR